MARRKRLCITSIETQGGQSNSEEAINHEDAEAQHEFQDEMQGVQSNSEEAITNEDTEAQGELQGPPKKVRGHLSKEDMYSLVKSKFTIHPVETDEIKKWIFHSMGKKWRTWKGSLKTRAYDPSLSIEEIVAQETNNDNRVNPTQFKEIVTRWFTPEFQSSCAVKRSSRSKMHEPHVTGTKSFARLAHEMAKNNNGVYPTRGGLYIPTHTRKDGSVVDAKAAEVMASLKAISSGSTSTSGDQHDFTNDDYSKVKGPEKRGYVRLVGRMPATKKRAIATNSPTDSQTIQQLNSVVNVMVKIIQEHIPTANLSEVLNNMNIQVPGISSSGPNNSLSVNQISPSRSHNNNGNH